MKAELLKKPYYVASVSGGKDSVWMVEVILNNPLKYPLNLVIFVNTGYEFEAVYEVLRQLQYRLSKAGIPYVEIDISEKFRYMMFEHRINTRDGSEKIGYKWCGGACRWGTALKIQALERYYREKLGDYEVFEYVGYAYDEPLRYERNTGARKIYPLVEKGLTEAQCLINCYKAGYLWKEDGVYLYEIMDRLSCWCCRNSNLYELKNMLYLLPKYFNKLKELQEKFPDMPMKGEVGSVHELEQRFLREGRRMSLYDVFLYPESLCGNSK